MATNDTIADMLTRIRNSCMARHQTTEIPSTKMTRSIAKVLQDEGFIANFEEAGVGVKKHLVVSLKYNAKTRTPTIRTLKRVSRPGLRVYKNRKELPRVLGGIGIAIISTSRGVMTDREARLQGLGGEVLCYVW
ncbi:MAG: 30S ribosomal protein S8 [Limnospira sp. PMC 1291.21]|uniref:30S ribosomal protein S8 n=1 Tax=unclassified Limnospira TaxID=2642885 RepID=UPI0028E105C6|nr:MULTISPECIES: 30S ribosomal protein S8 [unclassified Limnospira]MDT9176622.1 30S ribosomal protein S8 [Limnospira sp. PMC 1238.20]MDT9202250.1 30S ribosomal protein S8 [Limnospira sp. PMC 1243.20]MDT9222730.1 30S ribosomal protein S8 [Limnospira sp. PMC 1279.21]MDT9227762.1 30S ribosomal protein S8 [Limnospira sp. PMC 1242.20]MDT9237947.1 30S ribosomal protein S8 [Limnospira sp. PMC 1261.20]